MKLGYWIEEARITANIPVYMMCNTLDLETEADYKKLIGGRDHLSIYQTIMLLTLLDNHRVMIKYIAPHINPYAY
ncbi:hypothetical protein HDR63_00530 [bacterium]|nr:hypothetical protein [bacterium]